MKNYMVKIGLIVLVSGFLSSCLSLGVDRSVSFFNFTDKPELRERFIGTWRTEAKNGSYTVMSINADGTGSETAFNKNHNLLSTWGMEYKLSATQLMMRVSNNREAIFNYNFIDNNSFSLSSGSSNFLYRRTN